MSNRIAAALAALLLATCGTQQQQQQQRFPAAHRDVAPIVGDTFSTEDARDRLGEAQQVIQLAGVRSGMWVADVGAGQGYYTVRLARIVGPKGRVLAEDIMAEVTAELTDRVQRERLDNVAVRLGTPDNPLLPAKTFDRIFLVHMYHEVASPYAFLWHMREGLKPDGLVVVVEADRPVKRHGMPPDMLRCEFAALGLSLVRSSMLTGGEAYFAAFRASGPRPEPGAIKPCKR
ncbi:MAG TPA: methyltransferase domain-containing protein [Sphingomicrobium sp.]|nr:methyltransferase domain-containing protein [Sphingomicrobium sp.]